MSLSTRIAKAVRFINDGKVSKVGENTYHVESQGGTRVVILDPPRFVCSCPWGNREWLGNACAHAIAACGMADVEIPLEPEEVGDE